MTMSTKSDKSVPKPWGGRFTESTDALVESFTESVSFDKRLYPYDIQGSIAHARMLARVGVLTKAEQQAIVSGLEAIAEEIQKGDFSWKTCLEDVHMNIETRLTERIGEVGKKLHTGRSRNDQVATDLRLYLRDMLDKVDNEAQRLQQSLLDLAEQHAGVILPGLTHMQVAQPVTFGHHMLAWHEMLARDRSRLQDCHRRTNVMPLGAAALAGTTYPIDRAYTAELLGFAAVAENSLDAVSDRDFVIEFCACGAIIMTHLSRFSEELILWSSSQFNFIELPDRFCTGSSIMPQKKNPDVPELVRGKAGRIIGHLMALLTLMKGQPLAYNRDNQEDKEPLFDSVDTLVSSLHLFADMMSAVQVNESAMLDAARKGFATATDLADYLVCKGMPFRDAHEVVGNAVRICLDSGRDLADLTIEELKGLSALIEADVYEVLTLEGSIAARNHLGGTAPEQVLAAVQRARQRLQSN